LRVTIVYVKYGKDNVHLVIVCVMLIKYLITEDLFVLMIE